jgi:hypothetical protein
MAEARRCSPPSFIHTAQPLSLVKLMVVTVSNQSARERPSTRRVRHVEVSGWLGF